MTIFEMDMKILNKNKSHDARPVRHFFPIIYLLVSGILLSFFMFWLVYSWEHMNQRYEFESRAKAYTNAVEITLNKYVGALLFLGDFFNNSSLVTRDEFTGIVKSILPRYPGIQTFGWNPLVKDDERNTYESAASKDGFNNFEFTERSKTNQLVRAARREEYVVVYYLYPFEDNSPAFGYDIASNSTRLNAITKAFNTGKLSATDRITLVQETGNQFGILLLQPIYHKGATLNTQAERRKNRKGFVVEVLRIDQAIDTALKNFPNEEISFTLYDMSADEGKRLLHNQPSHMSKTTDPLIPSEEIQTGLYWNKTFNFAERQWKMVLRPSDFYYQSWKMWQSWLVLFGSLLLTTLLAYYMLKKILYTTEIEQSVKKQTQTNQLLKDEINVRTTAEAERDKTIHKLQQAIDEVQNLRGILPICSSCKKIRDDKGSWSQIEVYIKDHSEAEFSHGICPECAEKLYPEIHTNKKDTP
ncbi:MAG: CHASE domain-containing protein [Gammaproteobacteria bacterium]